MSDDINNKLELDIPLRTSLTIKDVTDIHEQLLRSLEKGADVNLDMSELDMIDTAGFQLLLAFKLEAGNRGVTVRTRGASNTFNKVAALLCFGD